MVQLAGTFCAGLGWAAVWSRVQGREVGTCGRHSCDGAVTATRISGISAWIWGENCALVAVVPMESAKNSPRRPVS